MVVNELIKNDFEKNIFRFFNFRFLSQSLYYLHSTVNRVRCKDYMKYHLITI